MRSSAVFGVRIQTREKEEGKTLMNMVQNSTVLKIFNALGERIFSALIPACMHFCRLLKLELDSVERNFLMSFSLPRDASINIFNALRRGAFNEEKHFFELRIYLSIHFPTVVSFGRL